MKKKLNILKVYFLSFLFAGLLFTACNDEETSSEVILNSWGPSPALRGGELRFIGTNLNEVNAIILPQNIEVTNFKSKSDELIVIEVPEETVSGSVVLKTSQGDITAKTRLTISEPITIASFSPVKVRPGENVTITGTYLNLIKEVTFAEKKSVTKFESQSREQLVVKVPMDAQTGILVLSNGEEEPILVETESALEINLPNISALSPVPVKAGTELTLTGADLDLVKSILFPGGLKVETFNAQSATEIKLVVPDNSKEGNLTVEALSGVDVEVAASLTLVSPAITEIGPNPAKSGSDITIKGSDLDLVTGVVFGGGVNGTIVSKDTAELIVTVPETAVEGTITLNTASDKSVSSADELMLVMPTITAFMPTETKTNAEITISGTDLDMVTTVIFTGDLQVAVSGMENEIVVKVPTGTATGPFTLVTTNGSTVTSATDLTILASNVPIITNMPSSVKPGEVLVIEGEKLDLFTDVIFPGDVYATAFGNKTPTLLEVVVPMDAKPGVGTITFVTIDNETTESPEITITAADPVQDWNLVFFDFDGTGSKDSWWGAVALENEPDLTLNGTNYGRINGSFNGWTDLFWRNSSNNFPGSIVGTAVDEYVLKFDINVLEPITGGNVKFRLQSSEGDFWWAMGPAAPPGAGIPEVIDVTNGWITITVEFSAFKDGWGWGTNSPTNLDQGDMTFGAAFDNGESVVNICVDNVRFHKK